MQSNFLFHSNLEESFPNESTSDVAFEMKCAQSGPDNVSGQWLHNVTQLSNIVMLCDPLRMLHTVLCMC